MYFSIQPPQSTPGFNSGLYFNKAFMDRFELLDIWREKCPSKISYTWQNKLGSFQLSVFSVDFRLVSKQVFEKVICWYFIYPSH